MEISRKQIARPILVPKVNEYAIPTDMIAPVERMRLFSDDQFESFVAEWAVGCIKPTCKEVYNFGGAGDKGRDVIAEFHDGTTIYFQCKKYDHPLNPSETYIEIGYSSAVGVEKKESRRAANTLPPRLRIESARDRIMQ